MIHCTKARKGLIIHSGAIGDCLLTLPAAAFIKRVCSLSQMHFMGRPEAIGFYPGRSCIDHVRPMESVPLHRLFEPQAAFTLEDPDRLITVFAGYEQIVSFLGSDHPDFEQNLLMTVHCSHAAQVSFLPLMPSQSPEPVSAFYIRSLAKELSIETESPNLEAVWLSPTADDQAAGRDHLLETGINPDADVALLHPGSGGGYKCWHRDNFLCLAKGLAECNIQPLFLFGPAEEEHFEITARHQFEAAGPVLRGLNLTEVVQILSQTDVFIGNDSGIGHMAGAMGKRTISIFGPTNPVLYRPLGPAVTVFHAGPEGFQSPCPHDLKKLLDVVTRLF